MNTPLNIQHGHLNFQPRIIGKEKACFRLMKWIKLRYTFH
jgi:hypothetical protein